MRDLIKKILREELTPSVKRRIDFSKIDSLLKKHRMGAFQKEEPTELGMAVAKTIHQTMYDIMPDGFEDDDTKYYKVWDEIKQYLNDNYGEELTQYFEKRQRDAEDEEKNAPGVKYIFVKHDKPYYISGWSGFADGFNSFNEMITKYGSWVNVDWDEVKQKLDDINYYPEPTYSDTMNSRPLRISSVGDEGNKWGYNFSIIKQVPKNNVDKDTNKLKDIQTEETHDELDEYSRTLKNARKQGSGLRFPKSAIKSNPLRFRPYNREMVDVDLMQDSKKEEPMDEGLHDTSWENDEGDKVTLIDLLDATEDIPVKNIPVDKIKSKLLTWDDDDKEVAKIEKADLQYPILIFVDDDGKFISIIDGHHRAQKAVRHELKRIKAKIIPINSLPKNFKKVFGHLGKQEQNESELTERCWKGYTQKGMKTMFGKRYPNCVKIKKK
jgi:hypothetical protein